jgi:hypothetical protein
MRKASISLMIISAMFLSGCGAAENTPQTPDTELSENASLPQVSQRDFDTAVSRTTATYDEFDELTYYLSPSRPVDGVSFNLGTIQYDDGSNEIGFTTSYFGADWIFFDTLEIRSEGETVTVFSDVRSSDKSTNVDDGVVEQHVLFLGTAEIDLLLSITRESKFRLSGSGGSVEREFGNSELRSLSDVVTVYLGLEQGLTP